MKKEFGLSRHARNGLISLAVFFVMAAVIVFFALSGKINDAIEADVRDTISNISEQNALAIRSELENRQKLLDAMANSLTAGELRDTEKILNRLKIYVSEYNFYNMGLLFPDGITRTTSGDVIDVSDRVYFHQVFSGKSLITESFVSRDGSGLRVNLLLAPVFFDGVIEYGIFATYRSRDLAELLNMKSFNGKGFSFILNKEGKAVVYPRTGINQAYLDLVDYISNQPDLQPGEEQDDPCITFSFQNRAYYAHYEKIGVENWYLMTCVEAQDAFHGAYTIQQSVLLGMGFLVALIFVIVAVSGWMYLAYQKKIQSIVFWDSLLEERNYEYLRIYYPNLTPEEVRQTAFVILDIDKFKTLNLAYGSIYGDYLLKYINRIFKEELPGDCLFRHVADQFAALLRCRNEAEVCEKLDRVLARIGRDIDKRHIAPFTLSMGICFPQEGEELHTVYSDALIARNTIKNDQMKAYAFYDQNMRQKSIDYMKMESDFYKAMRNKEFKVFYQPKYDMRTGKIAGAEALVRWVKADGTLISPGAFIPCFENSGQIVQLDEMMLEMVCRQMQEMKQDGLTVRKVSVNLSRVHLKQPQFTQKIRQMFQNFRIDPEMISFEVTESALYDDNISLNEIVEELHRIGCSVDMDDYGTGISSLNSLTNVDFDVLKLDKSFLDGIGDTKVETVIRSTIHMAEELGMQLVAEGVEERRQADFLVRHGCYFAQGFYYSRPVSEEDYRQLLKTEGEESGADAKDV